MDDPYRNNTDANATCPGCGRPCPRSDQTGPTACPWCGEPITAPSTAFPVARPVSPTTPAHATERPPWGFWATIGWSALVLLLFMLIQVIAVIPVMLVAMFRDPKFDSQAFATTLESNGLFLAVATLISAPVCLGMIYLAIRLRRGPVGQYLALNMPSRGQLVTWVAGLAVFILCSDGLALLTGRDVVTPFMLEIWQSAGFVPLLLLALIVFAPIWEEAMFRGFMFTGLASSPVGATGAVLIPSALWAVMHTQYDVFEIGTIFVMGIFLGIARLRTRSTLLTIILHAIVNLVAIIEVAIVAAQTTPA